MYFPDEQKYIERLTAIVEENFTNNRFGVAELAREMGMSHSTLHRKLRAIAKQSVSQFIRETRLKRAMKLLQLEAGTIAEIAFGVGFSSASYFSKCFHDYYGYPPGDVRKRFYSYSGKNKPDDTVSNQESQKCSVAVLPFKNFTGDDNQTFMVQGVHDALIEELGQLGSIRVVSRTSVLKYSETKKTIQEIAAELDVSSVIEGSVLIIDENIRIQIKLFDAFPEEKQICGQNYEVKLSNILKLYSQLTRQIAAEIQLCFLPEQHTQVTERREVNPECYREYLRGKYFLYQLTEEGMRKGLQHLHEAVKIDPGEPFAHAGIALGYMEIAHGPLNPGDAYIKAESAALQALKLDPNLAEAQLALAELSIYSTWKYKDGEKYFKRALELNPYLSLAHYHYSWLLFLLGRNEEAVIEHELAQKYDPFNPMIVAFTGILYAYVGRYEDAIREAHKTFEIQKDCPDGYFCLGETYLLMGKEKEAVDSTRKLAEADPLWKWVHGFNCALANQQSEAKQVLKDLLDSKIISWNAMGIAAIHGALGNFDEAFKWLTYEPHHAWVPWMKVMPMGKPLHKDARFTEFLRLWNLL